MKERSIRLCAMVLFLHQGEGDATIRKGQSKNCDAEVPDATQLKVPQPEGHAEGSYGGTDTRCRVFKETLGQTSEAWFRTKTGNDQRFPSHHGRWLFLVLANGSDQKWADDISHVRTQEGWWHLAVLPDQ